MSEKKSKQSRKEQKQSEIAHTILVNMHKNGDISVDQLPGDPRVVVNVLTRATAIATVFCFNGAVKELMDQVEQQKPLVEVVPSMPSGINPLMNN